MAFDGCFSTRYDPAMTQIRRYREAAGLTQKEVADKANTSQPQIMRLERGERKLTREWAERLAPIFGIPAHSLLFPVEDGSAPLAVSHVHVRGDAQAGVWVESQSGFADVGFDIDYIPSVPGRYRHLEQCAYRIVGPSMNKARLFDGDYVICVPYFMARASLQDGDTVVVERRRAGTIERTVKELAVKPNGECLLWPRSDDPRFQQPLSCAGPEPDGTEIEITCLVIGVFSPR